MKILKQLHLTSVWMLLTVCGSAFLCAPTPSVAQSTGLWVDVCSSNSVSYADETVCFYGNAATSAEAYASADLTECCYLSSIGVDLQVYQNGSLISDTGEPGSTYESLSVTPSLGATYTTTAWIDGCYGSPGSCTWENHMTSASTQAQFTGVPGFINPKYVVVGITYAPPGSSSNVSYENTTSVGSTTNLSQSFQSDLGYSVAVSHSIGKSVPAGGVTPTGGVQLTFTQSQDYTQGSNSSLTNTISKSSSIKYETSGTPTFAPVNDDYDYIWVWINPELITSYSPATGSVPTELEYNGFAFDPNDPVSGQPPPSGPYISGPDVIEVQVGCLNGDFQCPSTLTWANGVEGPGSYINSGQFARSWASASAGYQWAMGEMPNLTFDDVCQILNSDLLAKTPSQCPVQNDYTLLNNLPAGTTSDGRFTREQSPPNPIQYPVGGAAEQYDAVQMDTSSVAQGASQGFKQAFSVEQEFGVNWFGIFSSTTTMKQSQTLTWNYSWLNTLTTTTTLTNAFYIQGPPDPPPVYPAGEPTEFIGYQDNLFGTFIFAPAY